MTTFYSIISERRLVLSGGGPPLAFPELVRHAEALRADPRFDPTFSQVVDFRGLKIRITGGQGIRALASINPFSPEARRAVLVDSSLLFGLIRMYQALTSTDPAQLRLFAELEEAYEWLGLELPVIWPETPDAIFTAPGDPVAE